MASVAARVAGWQRRLGGQAGPLGPVSAGSGESPNGAVLQVEILLDGLWTDITSRVMTREGSGNVAITRGQPNEGSKTDPSTCRFQLNNRDGLFSPRNPLSPYYGKIGRNTQLRVSVPSGNDKSYRFWGEVASWPQKWDVTGTDVWVDLEAAGILRRLGQGASPIGSAIYLALAYGAVSNPVVAYWPCEDASGATSIASGLPGAPAMAISGTPTLASFTGYICSTALPVMGSASFTGALPAYTAQVATMVRFLLAVPSGGATNGQVLCAFTATGTIRRWEAYYDSSSGGLVGLRGRDANGAITLDTGTGATFPVNGSLSQISVELVQNGANVDYSLYVANPSGTTFGGPFGTATNSTVGTVTSVIVAPDQGLTGTTIGHVRVQTATAAPVDIFDLVPQMAADAGETTADRIVRLCATANVALQQIGSSSDTVAMGAQLSASLVSLIDDCAIADMGLLDEQASGLGLVYRTRASLENQSTALALSYSGFNLAEVPAPVGDDQYTRNDVTVSRASGSSARVTLNTGALSTLPPPAGVGPYPDSVTVNVQADGSLAHQAGWRVHLGTVDEVRYPTISVNLAHPTFVANPALRAQALALRPGDRLTISGMPAWLPPDDVSQLVLGYSETIDHFEHRITFNCVPESPYRTALLGDVTLGRLDTDGSQLAADVLATDTTLLVNVTAGPLWTTTDTPFDIRVGGEQMTVTAVTGAASPQPFTVVRSVNGVVKAQSAGTDVRLNQPMILAL